MILPGQLEQDRGVHSFRGYGFYNVYSMLKIEIPRLREKVIPGLRV
jgi:hypothetical protein